MTPEDLARGAPDPCAPTRHDDAEARELPAQNTPSAPQRGDRYIGDFRLVRKLGEGGMGIVYEAEQQHPRRPVALKVVRGGAHVSSDTLKRFAREAQTLAQLRHPGIAALFETGATEDGLHFFAMELIRGVTLSSWLAQRPAGPLSPHELHVRLSIFKKICDAVAYAHQRGVIHRDLKPANVLIPRSVADTSMPGEVPEIKILDFGLARRTDGDVRATTYLTEIGKVQGTLPYMSPEQVRGHADEIDPRTDVYSLGVMLYEMLTGRLPFDLSKAELPEVARIICESQPKSLSSSFTGGKRLDPDVITIANKCLDKESPRRYASAAQVGEDVQRYLSQQPILARPPSAIYQLRKLASRRKRAFAFAATVCLLMVALVASLVQARRIARERDRAHQEVVTTRQAFAFLKDLFKAGDPAEAQGAMVPPGKGLDRGAERLDSVEYAVSVVDRSIPAAVTNDQIRDLRHAVSILETQLPPDDRRRLKAEWCLGSKLGVMGQFEESRKILREGLAHIEASPTPDEQLRGWFENALGNFTTSQGPRPPRHATDM